jgi:magnesium transporter
MSLTIEYMKRMQVADFHQSWQDDLLLILFGTMAGSMLPFILRRCGLDPASASAPLVATLVDVTGLIIYFTVAKLVLTGTLL